MRRSTAATGVAAVMLLASCGSPGGDRSTLTVYAAASLAEPFAQIETVFESAHPGVDVVTSYAGSSALAAQIREGAPAGVFASANEAQMDAVAPLAAAPPSDFATNTLTLVVAQGNPRAVSGLEDLARDDVVAVVCAPQVPCGAATAELAARAGVDIAPASEEGSVTDVLGKVATGQADAGVVYATDVARADGVERVEVVGAATVVNRYPIAPLTGASDAELAAAYTALVLSAAGREILAEHGFGAP